MPRKPTGRPRGRPAGTGQLGEEGTGHKRLTVRLPTELYDALEAVAEREHYTREVPELARTVRAALEHYLTCMHRGQTGIVPQIPMYETWLTGNVPEPEPSIESSLGETWQPENVPVMGEENIRQTAIPLYDTSKYALGALCVHSHGYQDTGQSLRQQTGKRECVECMRVRKRAYKERKRQETGAKP